MGRRPCCSKEGMNRGVWTVQEDKILTDYIRIHGEGRWRDLPERAGLKRCGKSCRLRWLNYLRPDIKRGNITNDEEELIIRLHKLLGNRWSLIAGRLPGRTDNEIKNYWNTNLSKKVQGHENSSGSPHRKHSIQFDDEEKSKKKTMRTTPKKSTEEPARVVRTKASRCNWVFPGISQSKSNQDIPWTVESHAKKWSHEKKIQTSKLAPLLEVEPSKSKDNAMESDSYNGLSSFNQVGEGDSSPNFMTDIDSGCFSDLLNSNLMFEFGNGESGEGSCEGNSTDESMPSWDQPLILCPEIDEEKLDDWTVSQCIKPDLDLDFPSFTSLLGQVESWLGDC